MLKKKSGYVVAILGATGAVGKETLEILEERKFPLASLRLFASKRSAGEVMPCQGKEWKVEELTTESSFAGVDFALISATDAISREYGQRLGAAGVVVIDDSGVFRMEADVPLVVPEVNAHALSGDASRHCVHSQLYDDPACHGAQAVAGCRGGKARCRDDVSIGLRDRRRGHG